MIRADMGLISIAVSVSAVLTSADFAAGNNAYVAVFRSVVAKGQYQVKVIGNTAGGVSKPECERSRQAILEENGANFESLGETLRVKGQYASFSVECEQK